MTEYHVQAPDGKTVIIQGPPGASQEEVIAQAQRLYSGAAKPVAKANPVMAFIRGVNQSGLSSFNDEVMGGIESVLPIDKFHNPNIKSVWDGTSLKDAYDNNVAIARGEEANDIKTQPLASNVGKVTGAVAQGVTVGRVLPGAKAATWLGRFRNASAAGAVSGAASGAGAGTTVKGRVGGAIEGAGLGAALGGVVGAGFEAVPAVRSYLAALGGKGATKEAVAQLTRTLARQGYDVTSDAGVAALKADLSDLGPNASLADLGQATRSRAGVALRAPSQSQEAGVDAVLNRKAGQGDRVIAAVKANVAPRTDAHTLDDALLQQREQTALPLRKAALEAPQTAQQDMPRLGTGSYLSTEANVPQIVPKAVVPDDPVLQGIARMEPVQRALQGAKQQATTERDLLSLTGGDTSHLPDFPEPGAPLDMKSLDYVKRYLDGQITRAYSGTSAERAEAASLQKVRDALRDRMRAAVPEYGQYLDTYGEVSDLRDALAAGRGGEAPNGRGSYPGFARSDPETIAAGQADGSTAGQELARVGYARDLEDTLHSTSDKGAPADRILNNDLARARMTSSGVAPASQSALEKLLSNERNQNLLARELGGGEARSAARADADAGVPSAIPFNPTNPVSWLAALGRGAVGAVNLSRNTGVNAAILPRMVEQDPQAIARTTQELTAAGKQAEADALKRQLAERLAAQTTGNVIGAPLPIQGN